MTELKSIPLPKEEAVQPTEGEGMPAAGTTAASGQAEDFETKAGNLTSDASEAGGRAKEAAKCAAGDEAPQDGPELEKVLETMQGISEQLSGLADMFRKKIMYSDHQEKIIDQMHEELQRYKQDMYTQLIRPVLLDVIKVRDDMLRMAEEYGAKQEGEQNIPNSMFASYADVDLQQILEKNNVEIYRSQTGDHFDPAKQRALEKVPASEQSMHGRIAKTMSCGYSYNGRSISAEKVSIYYYEQPSEKESEDSNNG